MNADRQEKKCMRTGRAEAVGGFQHPHRSARHAERQDRQDGTDGTGGSGGGFPAPPPLRTARRETGQCRGKQNNNTDK